jgi:hypothetical protein
MVCDNVIEFEVVLADGSVVIASTSTRPDLFRALKGGSGNFGVVTRIKIETFKHDNKMWGGMIFHKEGEETRKKIFDYFANTYAVSGADPKAHWIQSVSFVNALILKTWSISSSVQYTTGTTAPEIFKPVINSDVSLISLAGPSTIIDQSQSMANLNAPGNRQLFATLTFKRSALFMEEFFKLAQSTVPDIENTFGLIFSISYQALPHSYYSKGAADNSLGLEDDQDDLIIALLSVTWQLGLDDANVYGAVDRLIKGGQERADQLGVGHNFVYLNYARASQDPIASYGPVSVQRLRDASAKYDPNGVFQKLVPGGFKIPKIA